ncbi:MAG: hypothetical protein HY270_17805 [Deltaproteobacteria bacterium]|nr:hypothetical protein [Deltaproteobacteria bacterium]
MTNSGEQLDSFLGCEVNAARLATTVSDEYENADAVEGPERRVEVATRELVRTINESDVESRESLRALAIEMLREEVQTVDERSSLSRAAATEKEFNAFGIAIPLGLMGMVLVFLFPLVGIVMFAAAAVMLAWGLGSTLLRRS